MKSKKFSSEKVSSQDAVISIKTLILPSVFTSSILLQVKSFFLNKLKDFLPPQPTITITTIIIYHLMLSLVLAGVIHAFCPVTQTRIFRIQL